MPFWTVSEPGLNTFLYDEPLGYQPGVGPRISLKLTYKQRGAAITSTNYFNCGPQWVCRWQTVILFNQGAPTGYIHMNTPMGGARLYLPDGATTEFHTSSTATYDTDGGGSMLGYTISYPNGHVDTYHYVAGDHAFLTVQADAFGHATRFNYSTTNNVTYLTSVVDADGQTNTLSYGDSAFPSQITSVTDPFGRTAHLFYDSSNNGVLTNITDVVGIISSFKYDSSLWVTNLSTPYGTTKFTYTDYGDTGSTFTDDVVNRSVMVVDALGGTNLYVFREHSSFVPSSYTSDVPALASGGNVSMDYHNTWYWGPRQAALLSTTNVNSLTTDDFKVGRLRNWLQAAGAFDNELSDQIGMQRDPSPDGVTEGHKTWYTYLNQFENFIEDSTPHPTGIYMVLPDGNDRNITYTLDNFGRPTKTVETWSIGSGTPVLTRTNQMVYDANGIDLVWKIGPNGETIAGYAYNANHQVIRMTNAVNDVTTYTYDVQGRLTSTHTPAGLTTTNIYFSSGDYTNWVQSRIDLEIGRTNTYTYANDLVFSHTDERGLTITNSYDYLQRLTGQLFPDGTTISNHFDRLDLVETVDRLGFTTLFAYDALRHKIAITNALGNVTRYGYCVCGSLDSVTDPLTNITLFAYDNVGRRVAISYPDGSGVTNKFDFLGRITNVLDGNANITNWYCHQGTIAISSNSLGQTFSRLYDVENRITNSVDQNGVVATNSFDASGRVVVRATPVNGAMEKFGYSAAGLVAVTNQVGDTTHIGYDAARRKIAETNGNSEVQLFTYDSAGNLTRLIDGNTHSTTWGYDVYGRVTSKTNANNARILAYSYDADGRLTNRVSLEKGSTLYKYDEVGNLTNITYATSSALTYSYDAANRLTDMSDAVGNTSFTYNEIGLLKSENGPWLDDQVSYSYTRGMLTQLSLAQPTAQSWQQSYTYDYANRIQAITSPAGTFTYTYHAGLNGKVTCSALVKRLLLPNGAYETNTFDTVGRLATHQLKKSNGFTQLEIDDPGYDLANRRTSIVSLECEKSFGYDHAGQLTSDSAIDIGGDQPYRMNEQLSYGYDAAGNLLYRTNNTVVESFQVNNVNELTAVTNGGNITVSGTTTSSATSVTVNGTGADLYEDATFAATNLPRVGTYTAVASDGRRSDTNVVNVNISTNVTFAYDSNGNMLSDGVHTYEWNDENELAAIYVTNGWRSEFVYDGKLRRRIEKDFKWNGSSWTQTNEVRFVYDGNLIIQHRDANNHPTLTLTRGKDLSGSLNKAGGIGGLLALSEMLGLQPSHYYYHSDGNGNVTRIINSSQVVVAKYLYDAFGNIVSASGPKAFANPYRLSSKPCHDLSSSYDYLFRFYLPGLHRWLNLDPLGDYVHFSSRLETEQSRSALFLSNGAIRPMPVAEMSPDGPNLYTFSRNAPLNFYDPYGEACTPGSCQAIACAAAAAAACAPLFQVPPPFVGRILGTTCMAAVGGYCCGNGGGLPPSPYHPPDPPTMPPWGPGP